MYGYGAVGPGDQRMGVGAGEAGLWRIWLDGANIDLVSSHLCSVRRSEVRRQGVDVKWVGRGYTEPERMISYEGVGRWVHMFVQHLAFK